MGRVIGASLGASSRQSHVHLFLLCEPVADGPLLAASSLRLRSVHADPHAHAVVGRQGDLRALFGRLVSRLHRAGVSERRSLLPAFQRRASNLLRVRVRRHQCCHRRLLRALHRQGSQPAAYFLGRRGSLHAHDNRRRRGEATARRRAVAASPVPNRLPLTQSSTRRALDAWPSAIGRPPADKHSHALIAVTRSSSYLLYRNGHSGCAEPPRSGSEPRVRAFIYSWLARPPSSSTAIELASYLASAHSKWRPSKPGSRC